MNKKGPFYYDSLVLQDHRIDTSLQELLLVRTRKSMKSWGSDEEENTTTTTHENTSHKTTTTSNNTTMVVDDVNNEKQYTM
mmetsp:Transcript_1470/g.1697  ORF Transcript_1470/g.1697 Transcript_1470/m.1697 type:complete len:81 (+) Transcript_1470:463-705(+)